VAIGILTKFLNVDQLVGTLKDVFNMVVFNDQCYIGESWPRQHDRNKKQHRRNPSWDSALSITELFVMPKRWCILTRSQEALFQRWPIPRQIDLEGCHLIIYTGSRLRSAIALIVNRIVLRNQLRLTNLRRAIAHHVVPSGLSAYDAKWTVTQMQRSNTIRANGSAFKASSVLYFLSQTLQ
jgi:hypothetical protein